MEYTTAFNELLEALAFLGAQANGRTAQQLEKRFRAKGVTELDAFYARYAPFDQVLRSLERECMPASAQLNRLFRDVPGLPYNTAGAFSPAFLLFSPMVSQFNGQLDPLLERMNAFSSDQVAWYLMVSLDLTENLSSDVTNCSTLFVSRVLDMTIPAKSKLALLDTHRNAAALTPEIGSCLRPVLAALKRHRPALTALAEAFRQEIASTGSDAYLRDVSSLQTVETTHYYLRPLLLAPDTNISLDHPADGDGVVIYCGVLRKFFQELLSSVQGTEAKVFDVIKLLGDKTRFDILCFLRARPAYGQELSDHFGLARNTIHHHMGKLLSAGLVTCTVTGNRVYYALDRERLERLLKEQREVLLG